MNGKGNVIQTICSAYDNMSKTDQKIATYILDNRLTVPTMALREIASGCGTSSPTVSRFIKRLGYDDFNDLRLNLARGEGSNPLRRLSSAKALNRSHSSVSKNRCTTSSPARQPNSPTRSRALTSRRSGSSSHASSKRAPSSSPESATRARSPTTWRSSFGTSACPACLLQASQTPSRSSRPSRPMTYWLSSPPRDYLVGSTGLSASQMN